MVLERALALHHIPTLEGIAWYMESAVAEDNLVYLDNCSMGTTVPDSWLDGGIGGQLVQIGDIKLYDEV